MTRFHRFLNRASLPNHNHKDSEDIDPPSLSAPTVMGREHGQDTFNRGIARVPFIVGQTLPRGVLVPPLFR